MTLMMKNEKTFCTWNCVLHRSAFASVSLISKDMDNILHVPLAPTSPVYLFLMAQHAYFSFTWQQNTCRFLWRLGSC